MDEFLGALLAGADSGRIPSEYDWFAPMIGNWDFDYCDTLGCVKSGEKRWVKGEWMFRRVLEGVGVEDIFICPSRATKAENPQPDAEYGVALRIFDAQRKCYNMVYTCAQYMTRLEIHKSGDDVECRVLGKNEKWAFSEMTASAFHWRNMTLGPDGGWHVNCEIFARRRA